MSDPGNRISRKQIDRDLRSPLLILAAVMSLAAAVCAVPGLLHVLDPETVNDLMFKLSLDYIDAGARQNWLFVTYLVNVLALAVPALIAVGLVIAIAATFCRKEESYPAWGVKYFSVLTVVVRVILIAVSVLLALLFVIRAVRYLIVNGSQIGGILFIFAMLLPEVVFAAVVAIILYLTVRAVKSAELTADNVRLNVLQGKCEAYGLKAGAVWLVAMMGVAALILLVIHRGMKPAVACYALAALSDFLIAAWLILYRKKNGQRALLKFRAGEDIFA